MPWKVFLLSPVGVSLSRSLTRVLVGDKSVLLEGVGRRRKC